MRAVVRRERVQLSTKATGSHKEIAEALAAEREWRAAIQRECEDLRAAKGIVSAALTVLHEELAAAEKEVQMYRNQLTDSRYEVAELYEAKRKVERDAERYLWLRNHSDANEGIPTIAMLGRDGQGVMHLIAVPADDCDEVVDVAMRKVDR